VEVDRQPAPEMRRLLDHRPGVGEEDARLLSGDRGGVDLGGGLVVGEQTIEADPGRERRLAVALAHLDVRGPEAPAAVGAVPAEERADDEHLGRGEDERAIGERALGQPQEAEEVEGVLGGALVEPQAALGAVLEVAQVAGAGEADERSGHDPPGDDVGGIGVDVGRPRAGVRRRRRDHGRGTRRRDRPRSPLCPAGPSEPPA